MLYELYDETKKLAEEYCTYWTGTRVTHISENGIATLEYGLDSECPRKMKMTRKQLCNWFGVESSKQLVS